MSLLPLLALNLAALAALVTLAWLISLPLRDASIMDVFWGLGFVIIVWLDLFAAGSTNQRIWLMAALVTLWGVRLASYLAWRKFGQPEDRRYRALRESFGDRFWWLSLFVVFGLQGLLIWVVSVPLAAIALSTRPSSWLDGIGVVLWVIGLSFEAIGDYQLASFKSDPQNKGQVFDRGLWRYTRHPNYFGDFLVWWGFYLIAAGGRAPWWVILSPVVMSVLLLRVSGVTLLEKSLRNRTAGYADYVARTSAFFPWPPRRS